MSTHDAHVRTGVRPRRPLPLKRKVYPQPAKLPKNTMYYFNAVVVALDPRGNSSMFGWVDGF
jgi:hypothetical protein